ncbi:MAG: UDP-N-acetylglucosamine--N-acetylmuramyl-(pentapeptide) pyrophosphoryl-undecaprenol N-acetylglucosamine transferase [Verrucomicrobiota bacterium]
MSAGTVVLLSCGGTGGHLSPGIAMAEGLAARGHTPVLIISRKKVDARLVEKYPHLRFERLPGAPLAWDPQGFVRFVVTQTQAFAAGVKLVRSLKPGAVVGFGGFTTAGVIIAGWLFRVPVALHEANRVPGRAIRTLSRLAKRVWLPPGVELPGVKADKIRPAGLPVRAEISRRGRAAACVALGLDPAFRVVVIFGGSQGAASLNDWARREAAAFAADGVQIHCVTGLGNGEPGVVENPGPGGATVRSVYSSFCDTVADLLSAADLVVGRAGAGTIAECVRCRAPAVLVPYPFAADDHQKANAAWFVGHGGGVLLPQERLGELTAVVRGVIFDDAKLAGFRDNLARLDGEHGLDALLDDLDTLRQ